MPNYVTNKIYYSGSQSQIDDMLESIKNDVIGKGSIDFSKLVPRPVDLDIEAGSGTYRGMKEYIDFMDEYSKKNNIEDLSAFAIPIAAETVYLNEHKNIYKGDWILGRQAIRNTEKYGWPTWYEWNINNWGTKWNACGYDDEHNYADEEELIFDTAWSPPHPILERLSEIYPKIHFKHEWADEDLGQNCGRCEYIGGKRTEIYIPLNHDEALEYACSVIGLDPEEYLNNDNKEDLIQ